MAVPLLSYVARAGQVASLFWTHCSPEQGALQPKVLGLLGCLGKGASGQEASGSRLNWQSEGAGDRGPNLSHFTLLKEGNRVRGQEQIPSRR